MTHRPSARAAPSRARRPRAIGPLLAGLLLTGLGCQDQVDLPYSFSGLGWVQAMRPDMAPVGQEQFRSQGRSFNDGGRDGERLISPLYPDTPLGRGGTMHAAQVLWIARGTPLRFSYQVTIENPRLNGAPLRETSGTGGGPLGPMPRPALATVSMRGATTPISRHLLGTPATLGDIVLTPDLIQGSWANVAVPIGVALEACTGGLALSNRDNPPEGLNQRCARTMVNAAMCGVTTHPNTLYPATVLRCPILPDQDASYRLRVVDANSVNRTGLAVFPRTTQPPLELGPHVKVIDQPRILLRELVVQPDECRPSDPPGTRSRRCTPEELAILRLWRHCNNVPQTVPPGTSFGSCAPGLAGGRASSPPGFAEILRPWQFSVADGNTGEWRETFGEGLRIRRIRFVHVDAAQPNVRRYLNRNDGSAAQLAGLSATSGANDYGCPVRVDGGVGDAHVDLAGCPEIFNQVANPAWMAAVPGLPIAWRLTFRESGGSVEVGQDCNRLVCRQVSGRRVCEQQCRPVMADGVLARDIAFRPESGDRLFMEFEVERAGR